MAGFYKYKGFLRFNIVAYEVPMTETNLADMGFSSTNIDARLIYLASIGTTGQTIKIYGNDPRTSASDAAVLELTTTLNNHLIEDL